MRLARRTFLGGVLAIPVCLPGCGDPEAPGPDGTPEDPRDRLRALLDAHVAAENAHDLDAILDTFAADGEMALNGISYANEADIGQGHVEFGMSSEPGGLRDTQVIRDRESFTDDAILIEGRIFATHVGLVEGFAGTGREVVLPYAAFYSFDAAGRLASERIVMDWGPLAAR